MQNRIYFYLPPGTINDATNYYCNLLENGFSKAGFEVLRVSNSKVVPKFSTVLTIRSGDQIDFLFKKCKFLNWFQGIGPEEYRLLHKGEKKAYVISRVLEFFENRGLKKSKVCFFVSDKMKEHYESKYKLDLNEKAIIIPCYNIPLNESYFNNELKHELKFVYAGGIFAWQCIDETLLIFKEIVNLRKDATLTLLTGDKEKALDLIHKFDVPNVNIDYVKLNDLQHELSKYTYGFLIRKDDPINNVSTPTKMNSYMAAGIIPIYTPVISAFEKNIDMNNFNLKFSLDQSYKTIAESIIRFHDSGFNKLEMYQEYKRIFEHFYNDEKYVNNIVQYIADKNGTI
ncbi:hypothetical protein VJ786_02085 [Sphingobacterium sp. PU5-4]|uniref:Glycosyltransferase family 4 protein n=1 Tax=Sphingobacterium tenebrionis TaxID=3111775 RepID=A0ABU8I395_9SPHI